MGVCSEKKKSRGESPGFITPLLLLSFVLGAVFISMVSPFVEKAHAANSAKIIIENTIESQTYHVYRIMDLKVAGDASAPSGYAYTANENWREFLSKGSGSSYVTISKAGNVTFKGEDESSKANNAKLLAKAAIAYAKNNKISPVASQNNNGKTGSSLTFADLPFGYYLVDSSVGSLCSLSTTSSTATIVDKSTAPILKKMVSDSSSPSEDEVVTENGCNNAAMGDVVTFEVEIKIGNGPVNYVLHDAMDKGLSFQPSSVIVKNSQQTLESGKAYQVVTDPKDGCSFEIVFAKDAYGSNDQLVDGDTYTVEYQASINEKAQISSADSNDSGNKNSAFVSYGDDSNLKSNIGETHTYVLSLPVYKFSNTPESNSPLKGAKFVLCNNGGFYYKSENGAISWVKGESEATALETNEAGEIAFEGIDEGSYKLYEVESPIGYNRLDEPIGITVKNSPSVNPEAQNRFVSHVAINGAQEPVKVENQTGGIFPGTGGPGAFLIAGAGLVFLALGATASVVVWRRGMRTGSGEENGHTS